MTSHNIPSFDDMLSGIDDIVSDSAQPRDDIKKRIADIETRIADMVSRRASLRDDMKNLSAALHLERMKLRRLKG